MTTTDLSHTTIEVTTNPFSTTQVTLTTTEEEPTTTEDPDTDLPPVADPTTPTDAITPTDPVPTTSDPTTTDGTTERSTDASTTDYSTTDDYTTTDYSTTENDYSTTDYTTTEYDSTTQDYDSTTSDYSTESSTTDDTTIDYASTTLDYESTTDDGSTDEPTTADYDVSTTDPTSESTVDYTSTTEYSSTIDDTTSDDYTTTDEPGRTDPDYEITTPTDETTTEAYNPCPEGTYGNVAHPHLCSSFYLCASGVAVELQCATGFEFDPELRTCVVIAPGGCTLGATTTDFPTTDLSTAPDESQTTTESVTPPPRCPVGVWGNIPHEYRCDSFYMCAAGNAIQLFCSDGFEFDPEEATCVPIAEGGCTYNSTTTTPEPTTQDPISTLCPPGTWGNVPHPEICESFYMCAGGLPIQLFCSEGFEFDPVSGACVLIAEGGCTFNKGTTTNNPDTTTESLQSTSTPVQTTTESNESETTTIDTSDTTTVVTNPGEYDTTTDVTTIDVTTPGDGSDTTTDPTTPGESDTTTDVTTPDDGSHTTDPTTPGESDTTTVITTPGDESDTTADSTTPGESDTTTDVTTPGDGSDTTTDPTTPGESDTTTDATTPSESDTTTDVTTPRESDTTTDVTTPGDESDTTTDPTTPGESDTTTDVTTPGESDATTDPTTPGESDTTTDVTTPDESDTTTDVTTPDDGSHTTDPTTPGESDTTTVITTPGDESDTTADSTTPGESDTTTDVTTPGDGSDTTTDPTAPGESDTTTDATTPGESDATTNVTTPGESDTTTDVTTPGDESDTTTDPTTPGESDTTTDVTTPGESDTTTESNTTPTDSEDTTTETQDTTTILSTTTEDAGTTTAEPYNPCPQGVFGNVPHPELCNEFFVCMSGTAIQVPCPNGFEFDPKLKDCAPIAEGGCTLGPSTTSNPEGDETTPIETTTVSDAVTDPSPQPICPVGVFGNIPHPEMCNSFYLCAGILPIQLFCPDGFEFDPEARACVLIAEGGCTLGPATTTEPPPPTTPAPICPPGQFGNIPHPDLCDSFYMCAGGTEIQLFCSDGFEFDPKEGACVAIAEGGCTLGSQTTPTIETTTGNSDEESDEVSSTTESSTTDDDSSTDIDSTTEQSTTHGSAETTESDETTDPPSTTVDPSLTTLDYDDVTTAASEETTEPDYSTTDNPESTTTSDYSGEVTTPGTTTDYPSTDENTETEPSTTVEPEISTTDASTTDSSYETTAASYETTDSSETTEAASTEESEEVATPVCPVGVYGNIPDPDRCDGFFICTAGHAVALTCSEGLEFDPELRVCVEIAEGGCTLGPATTTTPADTDSSEEGTTAAPVPTICPPGVFGNIPHPERCDAFYMCAAGQALLLTCSEGHEFDLEIRDCALITEGGCTLGPSTATTPADDTTASQTQPDTTLTTVESSETTTDSGEVVTTPEPICPPGVIGNIPHPDRCDAFYICAAGHAILQTCSEGHEFDLEIRDCAPIAEGGCTLGPSTATTPDDTDAPQTQPDTTPTTVESSETTTDSGEVTTPEPICPPGVIGNIPHPDRCDAFYLCAAGNAILQICSDGHEFSLEIRDCAIIAEGGCTLGTSTAPTQDDTPAPETQPDTTPTIIESSETTSDSGWVVTTPEPICPPGVIGNIPHPDRCDAFYLCAAGNAILQICSDGHEFSLEIRDCAIIAEGGCTLGTSTAPTQDDTPAPETQPDTTPSIIESSETTTDSGWVVTTPEPICPPGVIGNIPHPDRCDAFYLCAAGNAILQICSDGHEFSLEIRDCTLIAVGGCTLGSRSTIAPAEKATTAPQIQPDTTLAPSESAATTSKPEDTTFAPVPTLPDIEDETSPAPICPPGAFGNTAHPDRCDAFYVCAAGNAIFQLCTDGHEFSPDIGACAEIAEGGCTLGPSTGNDETTIKAPDGLKNEATSESNENMAGDDSIAAVTTPLPICAPGQFGNIAHPERCESFYMCTAGIEILLHCSEGFEYDPIARACVPIAKGGCTLGGNRDTKSEQMTTSQFECPENAIGNVADPARCDGFYSCTERTPIHLLCAHGFEFDGGTKKCIKIAPGGCTLGQTTSNTAPDNTKSKVQPPTQETETSASTSCPDGANGNIPDSDSCIAFYRCTNGQALKLYCAYGFEFNPDLQTCVEIVDGGCTLGTTAQESEPKPSAESSEEAGNAIKEMSDVACPVGVYGYMPDPEGCETYYFCAGSYATKLHCSDGFEFSPESKSCVHTSEHSGCTAKLNEKTV